MLTHTSGIPDYFDESVMEEYAELWQDYPNYKIRQNGDLLPLFIDKPMMYPAGERFQYNNTGYVVLAMIIEKLTRKPFDLFLQDAVFSPCGMSDTGYYELDRLPSKCANAYIYDTVQEVYYTNIYSVDAKSDLEFSSESDSDSESEYGYGLWLDKKEDGNYMPYFQGCDPGVSFIILGKKTPTS